MLVLTRKMDQKIKIGDQITITIIRVKGQCVRLGIEAPKEVPVVRSELNRLEAPRTDDSGNGGTGGEGKMRGHSPAGMPEGTSAEPAIEMQEVQVVQPSCGPLSSAIRRTINTGAPAPSCTATAGANYRSTAVGAAPLLRRAQRLGPGVLRSLAGRW